MDPNTTSRPAGEAEPAFLLDAEGVLKSYGATKVLRGMNFHVAPGEVHAFLGGNGAGKSTLLKIIAGIVDRDAGKLLYRGQDVDGPAGSAARDRGLAVVHQELAVIPHLSIAENIELPRYRRGARLFDRAGATQSAVDALSLIDTAFAAQPTDRLVETLSLHERQMVEIARALKSGAELLLLDEPTTNLTADEAERLFAVLRRLVRESRIAVVFVSHRMQEIRQVADVCTIIRDGEAAVSRRPLGQLTDADIVEMMGQSLTADETAEALAPKPTADAGLSLVRRKPGDTLVVKGLGLEVEIAAGQILGLAGAPSGPQLVVDQLIGNGQDKTIDILRGGQRRRYRSPRDAVSQGVGFVSGDRANRGILASLPIIDNLLASRRIADSRWFVRRDEGSEAAGLLAALKIKAQSVWDLPSSLSGGTQQKLIVARWLNLKPDILVLEEPTRGVDVGTKHDIYALIRAMADAGTIIVWWSSEQIELLELCHKILAFGPDGRATAVLSRPHMSEEMLAAATGLAA
jgi:ribose transport system ATP-binding protein